jgi:pheromone shutdown-related protein TraB
MNPSADLQRIFLPGREIILIGTAHVSQESVDMVRQTIASEEPDRVCVELDSQRYQALKDDSRWQSLNLVQAIRSGQGSFLLANLALVSFQKRMGMQTGVRPGAELMAAATAAEENGIALSLVDRNIRTTLLRAWRMTGFGKRLNILAALLSGLFDSTKIDEAELARLRQSDALNGMIEEMGSALPSVKAILIDERDRYMAHNIRCASGNKVVAVVGAAHVPGILRHFDSDALDDISALDLIPEPSFFARASAWLIPAAIIVVFIAGFFYGDKARLMDAALAWILATGSLSAIGTAVALGHPLTILTAFVAAPITTLHPALGVGFFTGLTQAWIVPPTVRDLEHVSDDVVTMRGWWGNRVTRVLLVFFFSSLGASIGLFLALRWLTKVF